MRKGNPLIWGIVPAAGVGVRMGAGRPKQYLSLSGIPIIQHSINRLLSLESIQGVVVAIAPEDHWWQEIEWGGEINPEAILVAKGGAERSDSVLNALDLLSDVASEDDWVLVHDAARPCLRVADLNAMVRELWEHPVGGILAAPLSDTIKRADADGTITETVDRSGLWRALTPQMFRLGMLRQALVHCRDHGYAITDDAQAIERYGFQPKLVAGDTGNMKITHPGDIVLAEEILRRERGEAK